LKIGIITKIESAEAQKLAGKVEKVLAQHSCPSVRIKTGTKIDKLDMIFVFGGDGTLLYAASLVGEKGIPILGVKMGGLGFLTEVKEEELFNMIEKAVCQNLVTEERMLLKAEVAGGESYLALNDIVFGKGVHDRMVEIDINIDGYELIRIRADGLIVATPTGSTAYCLAANGPIVHPEVFATILVPVCAHSLTLKPLVVPADSKIVIKVNPRGADTHLIADGRLGRRIKETDKVRITRAKKPLRLVSSPTMNYYEILRTKLGWGWK
jgi:NAD+ kinase